MHQSKQLALTLIILLLVVLGVGYFMLSGSSQVEQEASLTEEEIQEHLENAHQTSSIKVVRDASAVVDLANHVQQRRERDLRLLVDEHL